LKLKPTASAVVYKITEIKQADHEDVNDYQSRGIKIMMEFKSKIDQNRFVLPCVELTAGQSGTYEAVPKTSKLQ
jgi:hypothetical protein